jgi:hypothetical protein
MDGTAERWVFLAAAFAAEIVAGRELITLAATVLA